MTLFPRASPLLLSLITLIALARIALLRPADAYTEPPPNPEGCVVKIADSDREAMRAVYAALPQWMFFWHDGLSPSELFDRGGNLTYKCCVTSRPPSCRLWCPIECTPAGRITTIYSEPSRDDMPGPAGNHGGSCPPGALSSAIGDLAELSSLVFRHSCLVGDLPDSVTRLQKLTEFDMPDNNFSGPIPPGLFRLPALRHVDLSTTIGGGLSGPLPDGPDAYSPSLETVRLSANPISGELPRALFRAPALRELRLEANNLTGELPGEAGAYSRSIVELSLRSNSLTGGIPSAVAEMTALRELDLGDNGLSGSIPPTIATLSPLTRLALDQNRLTGDIGALVPAAAASATPDAGASAGLRAALPQLDFFNVGSNQLSGDAAALAPLPRGLNHLNASRNNLTSSAGSGFAATVVDLSHNRIVGALVEVMRNVSASVLLLAHNELSGSVPADLLSAVSDELDLSHNLLSSTVSPLCGPGTRIDLSHNLLSGTVPSLCGPSHSYNCSTDIDLSYNNLTGELPRDADAYQVNIGSLSLRANDLSGAIPLALAEAMRGLTYLDLGENRLSGAPTALASLRGLDVVRLDGNALSGPFCHALLPARELWLGFNAFGGGGGGGSGGEEEGGQGGGDLHGCVIPAQVEMLSAPHAGLRGSVPDDLFLRMDEQMGRVALGSQTQSLHVNLSHNSLTGSLKAFSVIRNGSLDVSHNNFTGSIPEGLFRLASTGGLERGASGSAESRWGLDGERAVVDVQWNELSGPLFDTRRPASEWPSYWNKLRVSGNSAAVKDAVGAGYLPAPSPGVQASAAETAALLAVRDALLGGAAGGGEAVALVNGGNSSWAAILSSWNASSSSASACEWYGVGCTADGHVHTLHLLGDATVALHPNVVPDMPDCQQGQQGDMSCTFKPPPPPHTAWFLQGLRGGSGSGSASASGSGSLSEALGQLTLLTSLRISGHALSGGLPPSLSRLSHLVALDLSSNRHLSGSIPPALFTFPSLRELSLRRNNLTGAALPSTTAAAAALPVASLESLDMGENALSGSIAAQVSLLTGLTRLALDHNRLDGRLPRELGALWMLQDLHLQGNAFQGGLLDLATAIDAPASAAAAAATVGVVPSSQPRYGRSLTKVFPLLDSLDISSNQLSGDASVLFVPWDANYRAYELKHHFPRMRYLNASHNNLTSESELNVQTIASVVDLSHNQISGWLGGIINVAFWHNALMDVLRLSHNQLSGEVPIWLLRAVGGELDLSHNLLSGTLDDILDISFWDHAMMDVLRLSHNQLSGEVTSYLLRSVGRELDLSHNLLTGTLAVLNPAMTAINLSHNNFSGAIPPLHGALETCDLSHNQLEGAIPPLGPKLVHVNVSWNNLTGLNASVLLQDASALRSLDVSHNAITGGLPAVGESSSSSSSSGLTGLTYLDLSFNSFSGALEQHHLPFPTTAACSAVQSGAEVRLSHNALTGSIPDAVFSPCLSLLDLSHNHLSGPIPDPLKADNQSASLLPLSHLDLSSNQLTGPIPDALTTSFTGLTHLSLSHNQLSGSLLPLSACARCTHMDLSYNLLSGAIPDLLQGTNQSGLLLPLSYLDLSSNKLTGPIPDALTTSLTGLTHLSLSHNQLSGSLLRVAACSRCTHVDLSYNLLSGAIPPLLASSSSPLAHLNLSSNQLSGSLPRSLTLAPLLTHLDLSRNKLKGSLPAFCQGKQRLASLLLSSNAFSGPLSSLLPSSSCASSLLSLNVSTNQISGSLPSSLSRFTVLHSLQTARNRMSGSIPAGLASLKSLQELDVSWSGLSGTIPACLRTAAPSLQVQLAGNSISGSVPTSLSDLPVSCFRPGNPKLSLTSCSYCAQAWCLSGSSAVSLLALNDDGRVFPAAASLKKVTAAEYSYHDLPIRSPRQFSPTGVVMSVLDMLIKMRAVSAACGPAAMVNSPPAPPAPPAPPTPPFPPAPPAPSDPPTPPSPPRPLFLTPLSQFPTNMLRDVKPAAITRDAVTPDSPNRVNKHERHARTMVEKTSWLQRMRDDHLTLRETARMDSVQPGSIRRYEKVAEEMASAAGSRLRIFGGGRQARYPDMELSMYKEFLSHRSQRLAVSIKLLQTWSRISTKNRHPEVDWRASP
ncbi:unnamed protein product [Closterium sp. NIES-54]